MARVSPKLEERNGSHAAPEAVLEPHGSDLDSPGALAGWPRFLSAVGTSTIAGQDDDRQIEDREAHAAEEGTGAGRGEPGEERNAETRREQLPVRAELPVGPPGGVLEQEADTVAENVSRQGAAIPVASAAPRHRTEVVNAHRPCLESEEGQVSQPLDTSARRARGVAEQIMRMPSVAVGGTSRSTGTRASVPVGDGQPLPNSVRSHFESRFGRDFRGVRVHTDACAAQTAQDLEADAYTIGRHVVFGEGQFAPHAEQGQRLLAHELTHVVQQANSHVVLQRKRAKRLKHLSRVTRKNKGSRITWKEAAQVLDAIIDIINNPMPYVEVREGLAYRHEAITEHTEVSPRWQPLLREWWMIANGTVEYPDHMEVSYYGRFLTAHIDRAARETAPLVQVLLAGGDDRTPALLAEEYTAPVREFRARAVKESVSELIETAAAKGLGGGLDVAGLSDVEQLKLGSSQALATIGALMTVAQRTAATSARQAQELDAAYAEAIGQQDMPPSLQAVKTDKLLASLLYLQGSLRLVQAIVNVADPASRREIYARHAERFGRVGGAAEILKNLGQFVSGAAAVGGVGTYAVAKVMGKAELAAQALSVGTQALGHINVALNALGVIHGIVVLLNEDATGEEKAEAVVEIGSGGLGLLGRFVPALSGVATAASASLLINFYAFRGLLNLMMQGVAGLIAFGLNICYGYMSTQAKEMSWTAMRYAAALDLAMIIKDRAQAVQLAKQTEGLRWNLVEFYLKPFMENATRTYGAQNRDPGAYEMLRRRFTVLQGAKLQTPAEIVAFTKQLLETIVSCHKDAKEIYQEQVKYTWEHH